MMDIGILGCYASLMGLGEGFLGMTSSIEWNDSVIDGAMTHLESVQLEKRLALGH